MGNVSDIAYFYSSQEQQYLLHAMISHTAVALAKIGRDREDMLVTGYKFNITAMQDLRCALAQGTRRLVQHAHHNDDFLLHRGMPWPSGTRFQCV